MREATVLIVTVVVGLIIVAAIVGLTWVLPSHFEARAFNRVTGKNVSTWDAMFVDLRVQAEPNK